MKKPLILFAVALGLACKLACKPAQSLAPKWEASLKQLEADGEVIPARRVAEIPVDPEAPSWNEAQKISISLGSQVSVVPRSPSFRKMALEVRALYDRHEIGLSLSWDDPTQNDSESGTELFRDAVAVGFPVHYGDGAPLPYIGMGSKGRPVAIWHWKASWDRPSRILRGGDNLFESDTYPIDHRTGEEAGNPLSAQRRTSPVENLLAEGFGTLTSVPNKGLAGKGIWKNGRWHVVIKGPKTPQALSPVTFAVWDGAEAERNGMKGLARWRFLRFEGEAPSPQALKALVWEQWGDSQRGRQLMKDAGCVSCHNLPDSSAANDLGPDLTHTGALHRPEYLFESIKDPNAVVVPANGWFDPKAGTSTMPSFEGQITDQDIADMVEYLKELQ